MAKAVFGIAKDQSQAIAIADSLKAAGFSANDVSVLFLISMEPRISLTSNIPRRPRVRRLALPAVRC
jgi:hypothetical protein